MTAESDRGDAGRGDVEAHYGRGGDLTDSILALVQGAGADLERLGPRDLALFDELHIRGLQATDELIANAGFQSDQSLLDVGSGLGGPARILADTVGCRVTGIDLTASFCDTAQALTERVGMTERVGFKQGDALDNGFAADSFDGAWMLHANMNIADKVGLVRETARVLKPGAVFACYEVHQGPGGAIHFPVPWADAAPISHLVTQEAWRAVLEAAGFAIEGWRDCSEAGAAWAAENRARLESGSAQIERSKLIMGESFRDKITNLARNLEEDRITVVEAICRRG